MCSLTSLLGWLLSLSVYDSSGKGNCLEYQILQDLILFIIQGEGWAQCGLEQTSSLYLTFLL